MLRRIQHRTALVALGLALLLPACSSPSASTEDRTTQASTPGPSWLPADFSPTPLPTATHDEGSPVIGGLAGFASIVDGHAVLIDPATGREKWRAPSVDPTAKLAFINAGGKEYLAALTGDGTAKVTVAFYSAAQVGPEAAPTDVQEFNGEAVSASAFNRGILVTSGGSSQAVTPLQAPTTLQGAPVAIQSDAVLSVAEDRTFSVASFSGAALWASSDVAPEGAADASKASFISASDGIIVSSWPNSGADGFVLGVMQFMTGEVLAQVEVQNEIQSSSLVPSADHRWVVASGFVFDVQGQTKPVAVPQGFEAQSVERGVVYGTLAGAESRWDSLSGRTPEEAASSPVAFTPTGFAAFESDGEVTFALLNPLGDK